MTRIEFSSLRRGARGTVAVLFFGVAGLASGCASSPVRTDTVYLTDQEPSEAQRYMPLEEGTVYAYDTRTGKGEKGVMTIQVRRAKSGEVDLVVGGHTEHLAARADGIRFAAGGYYLKSPLTAEHAWEGRNGTVRVESTEAEVSVPAGSFTGCLRTVEQARSLKAHQITTSIYCPHIGLVMLDIGQMGGAQHETAMLRSFGKRYDPLAEDTVKPTDE